MTTITTTAAATQAGVTVATIRTWCRRNVVAAVKVAGRWVIDTASLAHRITIGAMRTRKQAPVLDLNGTYTYTQNFGHGAGDETFTITTKIRTRERPSGMLTTVRGIHPFFADRIDAIADRGTRLHTIEVLHGAGLTISETPRDFGTGMITNHPNGLVSTTFQGSRDITIDMVLDLGEQIRIQLGK